LRQLELHALIAEGRRLAWQGDYASAAQFGYWAVTQSGSEQYDLACYLEGLGKIDWAFYWLQVAGFEDGIDASWANADPDLKSLRKDPRWPPLLEYLRLCNAYWAAHPKPLTLLVVPKGYDGRTPLTTLVWLQGSFDHPDYRRDPRAKVLQEVADKMDIAIVCVSGTVNLGKAKFNWTENPEQDYERVQAALKEIEGRVAIRSNAVIALGFSMGGQVGLEIAARHPETFAGAIAIVPGAGEGCQLREVKPSPLLPRRGVVIICGSKDGEDRLETAQQSTNWFRAAGARVEQKTYPGMGHTFPPDFTRRFPEWLRFIEEAQ
jgi:predicted esterase